jgi:polysaccharide biosynthesis/export protein
LVVNLAAPLCTLFRAPSRALLSTLSILLLAGPILSGSASQAQAPSGVPTPASTSPINSGPVPIQIQTPTPTVPTTRTLPNASNQNQTQNQNQTNDTNRRTNEETEHHDSVAGITQEPPTPFQLLVQESTGLALPIFGESLFSNVPTTFAPVDDIPVAPDYVIGPGDEIRVQIYGQVNQQGSFVVDRTGDIAFPDVGTFHVAGVRYSQLEAFLKSQLSRVYRNFDLTVNLGQLRSMQIFVLGEARRPGAYTVSSLSTLLNALFASGGPLPQGSLRDIQVQRNSQTIVHFDLYDLLLHGDKSHDIKLEPGDVIFIPVVGMQAAVAGSVDNPAIYEIAPGTKVSQLIELAGGKTSVAVSSQVRLERIFEHSMRSIVDVPLSPEHDPALADGDIINVGAILDKYNNAVTLRGNVTSPGRYVWHPGMRILDLVPTKDQLITRDYYRRNNQLGNTIADYSVPGGLRVEANSATANTEAAVTQGTVTPSTRGGSSLGEALTAPNSIFGATTDVILPAPDLDWSYAVIERLNTGSLTTTLTPFNPGLLYLKGDQSQNLELLPGDVVTFFSTADLKVPTSQQTRFVRLEGEFNASGVYAVEPGETLRHLLERAGGLAPDAYLYGSQFTRLSTRRVQQQRLNEYADNLEAQIAVFSSTNNARATSALDQTAAAASAADARAAVARLRTLVPIGRIVLDLKPDSRTIDEIPDLPLEDGDRFVVPRVPSTVSVEGQVYSANAFVFRRGLKESDYLHKAGGPDRQADKKRAFVLRADGSVYSSQYGNVAHATMFPGDTIVMPPSYDRRAVLRNLLDFSTVVSQFGLGAAAVEVLK